MLVPSLPRCFWVETAFVWWMVNISQVGRTLLRQRIGQFSGLFLLEPLAQFHHRLWDCLCPHSSWVLGLRMIVVLLRKFSQLSLICLSLECVTGLLRHLLSVSSTWIHFWWGRLWLSDKFQSLLEVFWLTWGSRLCRSFAGQLWQDFHRWLHYLSPLGAGRNLQKSASFSPRKRVVCTRRFLFSTLDLLSRGIVNIGCHPLG